MSAGTGEKAPSAEARLWEVIDRYAAMQEEHLAALGRGALRGVVQWQVERERAFNDLRRCLDALGDLGTLADRSLALRLSERIGALLARENRLQKVVRDGRKSIREQQIALRKGRRVVARLRTQPEAGAAPRFVSSTA
ncbi:MAG TPA: hypothetical protein ENN98_08710 [Desulfurivibrio alkaliphilus]|uniref:Uncharacterized protein n=1 Tax=Desulfurivibrio alkaliphilus TaxID=427923 RepID=A0A7C2TM15_9BACT|nr:hypothetical protein [Desulfurivibrio alkaliphilus]